MAQKNDWCQRMTNSTFALCVISLVKLSYDRVLRRKIGWDIDWQIDKSDNPNPKIFQLKEVDMIRIDSTTGFLNLVLIRTILQSRITTLRLPYC
jgi:hypothetical protein